jgi:hypothetical protein
MEGGAMPKGWNESSPSSPSDSGSAGSSAPKSGNSKIGISIAIGITAVALAIGIGFTGVLPMGEETPSVMEPTPTHTEPVVQHTEPVVQQTQPSSPPAYVPMKSAPSYASSGSDLIDQLDWTISDGDVKSMYIDKSSSALIIKTSTMDDVELFVGLSADHIGSDDGTFFIIVDNQEHEDYEQAGMDLYIDLPAGAETVEIIGTYVVS